MPRRPWALPAPPALRIAFALLGIVALFFLTACSGSSGQGRGGHGGPGANGKKPQKDAINVKVAEMMLEPLNALYSTSATLRADKQAVVIARSGSGTREMFTVRRIVQGEGVERKFPLHSPRVAKIKVTRSGVVRRAKLYYLRDRVGKAVRLKERRVDPKKRKQLAAKANKK